MITVKKKMLTLLIAVVTVLPLVFAAIPVTTAATLPAGWDFTRLGGCSQANFHLGEDGSVAMGWGNPDINYARMAIAYDASRYNNNYTVTVDVRVPDATTYNGVDNTGSPVVGVKGTFDHNAPYNDTWTRSAGVMLSNAQSIATAQQYAEWGNTYNICYPMDGVESIGSIGFDYFVSQGALNIKAGEYNTVKIKVEGNLLTVWVNGTIIWNNRAVTSNGNWIVLGSNGDCGVLENFPRFKNFKIESNDGSVETYTAFTDNGWLNFLPVGSVHANFGGYKMSEGIVTTNQNGSISMTGVGGFGSAGIYSNSKIDLAAYGVALNLSITDATVPGQMGAGAIIYLSKEKFDGRICAEEVGNNEAENVLNSYAYSAICNTAVTAAYVIAPNANGTANVHGGTSSVLCSAGKGYTAAEALVPDYTNFVISFTADENYLYFFVNGVLDPDYTLPRSSVLDSDGRVYIAITSTGYGSAIQTVTLNSITQVGTITAGNYQSCTSGWSTHSLMGDSSLGNVVYNHDNTITLDASMAENWSYAGITSRDKIKIQNATVVFDTEFTLFHPNSLFGVILSKVVPTQNTDQSTLVGDRTYHPDVGGTENGLFIGLHKETEASTTYNTFINGITYGLNKNLETSAPLNQRNTISFSEPYDKGDGRIYVKIYLNGVALQEVNAANVSEKIDVEYDITGLLDENGQVYLTLFAVGEQQYKTKARVYSVNGEAPNCTHVKNAPVIIGSQYRINSVHGNGLRFATAIEKSVFNGADLQNVIDYGTLIMPADKVGNAFNLRHTGTGKVNGYSYVDIKGTKYTWEDNATALVYTTVLINIPDSYAGGTMSNFNREFVAVSYVRFSDNSIVYSKPCTRSISFVTEVR